MTFFGHKKIFFGRPAPFFARASALVKKREGWSRFLAVVWLGGVLVAALFWTRVVHADTTLPNPIPGATTITDVLTRVVNYLNLIVDPLIVLMVLWGGLQILMGGSDETKFKEGKNTIKYAAIGAIVIICASGLVYLVAEVMKVSLP